jgi:hypothetical protein
MNEYWNYILASLDVVGLVALRAVGKKDAKGWLWAMLTQAVWMVYSVSTLQWGFLAVAAIKLGVYTWNWASWVRSDKAAAKQKTPQELAFDLVKTILPAETDAVVQAQAAHFLTKAIAVASKYPEKAAGATT